MKVELVLEPAEVEKLRTEDTRRKVMSFVADRLGIWLEETTKLTEDQQYRYGLDFHFGG